MKILNRTQVIESEKRAVARGIDYDTLMRNAGVAAAKEIVARFDILNKKIIVVCGNGNNGGDGFVVANELAQKGALVSLMLPLGNPRTETAVKQYNLIENVNIVVDFHDEYEIIIDALFGIGLARPIENNLGILVEKINSSGAVRISLDIPSGVFCDGGVKGVAVKADLTLTMIAPKPCFYLPRSNEFCGEVKVLEIGTESVESDWATNEYIPLPKLAKNSHKGSQGSALLVCGSYGMCGAEILATKAALRSGVGIARAVVCDKNYRAFTSAVPEAVTIPVPTLPSGVANISETVITENLNKSSSVLIGCGLTCTPSITELLYKILPSVKIPLILDADGINAICSDISIIKKIDASVILTPHPAEMARLCKVSASEIENNRTEYAKKFAEENNCILVLKGANTIIASPDGRLYFNTTGNPGLATGGSGDVLSGIIVSLLAQGVAPLDAALIGVREHGLAGDAVAKIRGERGVIPSDIIDYLRL